MNKERGTYEQRERDSVSISVREGGLRGELIKIRKIKIRGEEGGKAGRLT